MVISSDETQVQSFADWPMSHARLVTKDNTKNPEYHHCRCRDKDTADRLQTKSVQQKNHGQTMLYAAHF